VHSKDLRLPGPGQTGPDLQGRGKVDERRGLRLVRVSAFFQRQLQEDLQHKNRQTLRETVDDDNDDDEVKKKIILID